MSKKSVYRVYFSHPGQRVTDKTTTECPAVAEFAMHRLEASNYGIHAEAIMSKDGKQVAYCNLQSDAIDSYVTPALLRDQAL